MGVLVLALGKSGSGKSTSLRNFEDGEVGIFNVLGKPLPFRKKLSSLLRPNYAQIKEALARNSLNAYVIDDSTYLMQNENFARAQEKGYTKFTEMAVNFQQLVNQALQTNEDTIVYFLHHVDYDETGQEKVKSIGKMLDSQYCIEGVFPIVINCTIEDGEHVFVTKSEEYSLAKAPEGMLPAKMPNDLKAVDAAIREYYQLKPLGAKNETA